METYKFKITILWVAVMCGFQLPLLPVILVVSMFLCGKSWNLAKKQIE